MKKYRNYIIAILVVIAFCISICFVPIDATRFVPQVEKQFAQVLGVQVHIDKLIFRFGPALKIKAPVMHMMYQDGQKFGQLDNVKFFVPWSTLFKDDVHLKRIYADKFIIKTNSNDKYLQALLEKLDSQEYDMCPNVQFRNYNISYNDNKLNKSYSIKGQNLELTKLENFKNIKLVTDGDFYINDKQYINYNLSILPNIEMEKKKANINLQEFVTQVENLGFHSDIMADLKIYKNLENELQISGLVNLDNISVLDPNKKNPKSFIYLTFLGNKIGVLSNIYATGNKKIYAQGVINNSKKPEIDVKVKTDEIKIIDIYNKIKLLVDCSKYKGIDYIDGDLLADFNLKGDLNKIKSSGFMKIKNGSIKAGNLNINNIDSNIDFSNNVISINDGVGYVNSAPIIVKGKIDKNIDLELLMNKVELKHLLPEQFGVQKGLMSVKAKVSGTFDNFVHKENILITNFKSNTNKNLISFDSLKVDTNTDSTAYISNIIVKPEKIENIKLPLLKLIIENDKIKIPETNIFMPNSNVKAKAEITNYNTADMIFSSNFNGYINSKDMSGYTNMSAVFPVKLDIYGNKEAQNINGQIEVIKAILLDEPAILNLNSKLENNSLKIDDLSLMPLNDKNSKLIQKSNKKIIISGNIDNLNAPEFKNLRIYIPQPVNICLNDILAQIKGDIFVNGKLAEPEIIGQITAQNAIVQYMQLVANNLSVDFNKNIAVVNAPSLKVGDTSAGVNATVSTNFKNEILVKNLNVKSKYFNTDTLLMYKDRFLSAYPISVASGKFYSERASVTLYNSPLYLTAINSDFSLKNNLIKMTNLSSEAYNGKMAGNLELNLKDESFKTNLQARGVSAAPIFDLIAIHKDTVSGAMDFDTSMSGNLSSKQSLNGNIKFVVHNGHMGTLGKLEHLLYAQNVIADNMLRTSLSVVTKAITLKDTGLFKYLRGDIAMKNGIANVNLLQSQGPLMSLFIKGQYYPMTDYAKLTVLGRLSDEIVSGLGSFGEFSFNKLMIMLTGDDSKLNLKVDDIDKLPQLPMKNTKEFRTVINGILEKPSSVIQFNWISYTQKSLRQKEVPMSNEKVPDFIEALPY